MKCLAEGKKVRRKSWCAYVTVYLNNGKVEFAGLESKSSRSFDHNDIQENDWEVVQ